MKPQQLVTLSALMLMLSTAVPANAQATQPHPNYLQIGYSTTDISFFPDDWDANGVNVAGQYYLDENITLRFNYDNMEAERTLVINGRDLPLGGRATFIQAGINYNFARHNDTSYYGTVQLEQTTIETEINNLNATDESDLNWGVGAGVRTRFFERVNVGLEAQYLDINDANYLMRDSIIRWNLTADYDVTKLFSAGFSLQFWDNFYVASYVVKYRF